MRYVLCSLLVAFTGAAQAGEKAITLFNGKDLAGWKLRGDAKKSKWEIGGAAVDEKGKLTSKPGGGDLVNIATGVDLYTEREFGDCIVECEVMVPKGGNSGIYLMGRYEVQVFDSFGKKSLGMGDMGAIYSVAVPKLNACKKSGEWQKFVIDFQAPRFDGKKKTANAVFKKVTLNEQVIHENAEVVKGVTGGSISGSEAATGPLLLQGDHSAVAYRNIRVTTK
jgi:3-keto-disaccharide hydrolase